MIGTLIRWVRDLRIRHYHRQAAMFGTAVLAAQINRDWPAADEFHRYQRGAIAKRDALLAKQPHRAGMPPKTEEVDRTLQTR